jgi:Fe-S-cluster containining protein
LKEAVEQAVGRADVREAVEQVYRDLQQEIDIRKPVCKTSGRCCHFEEFGHRLYVTTMELVAFRDTLKPSRPGAWDAAGCPFQIDGLCSVHAIRPFGCRVFFCDASATDWQNQQYERFHTRIKRLHEELAVPYFYVEWRLALRSLDLLPHPSPDPSPPKAKPSLSLEQLRL